MTAASGRANAASARAAKTLRVAIDAACWHNNRGYGRHIRALLRAVAEIDRRHEHTLFLDSPPNGEPLPREFRVQLVDNSRPAAEAASANGRRSVADMWRMARALSAGAFDLVFFPTVYSYVPVLTRARKLVMIHDVIAETFPALTAPAPAARLAWNVKTRLGRAQADALATVSEYSRRRISERFGIDPGRIHVVGEAPDPVFRRIDGVAATAELRALGVDPRRRIVAYVGGFGPHKNVDLLVRAFARCSRPDVQLVLVGEYRKEVFHSSYGDVARLVDELGVRERTVFTGYLPDAQLAVLLNLAAVLALPSMMEGFGLPAVEAAACGCPVIATVESPLPQLLAEGGIFIRPQLDELAAALEALLESEPLRARMGRRAMEAARRLTWHAAARQLVRVMEEAAR